MALHRDIYWVGKQWAVTGLGIQACNQRQRSQFDIAAARLWDDGVQDAIRSLSWVNQEDFDRAVIAARERYPEPLGIPPPAQPVVSLTPPPSIQIVPVPELEPQPSRLASPTFDMRLRGVVAKLRPVWRIRA